MATTDLESADIKLLKDIATCCLCSEVYMDPIVLPCIHAFCMKCLQEAGLKIDFGPEDKTLCPVCERMFVIPPEGFLGLSKNFLIERSTQGEHLSYQPVSLIPICDACLEENEDASKEVSAADTHCADCNQNFCQECCRHHRKLKLTKHHRLIPMTEHESGQTPLANQAPTVCELHEQKVLDVYCADCKTVVCAICFIDDHNNHKGSHIRKYVDGFRKQIESYAEAINECRTKAERKKTALQKLMEDIQEKVENLESDIEKRKDELKEFTDSHATSLLRGLYSIREGKLKEIQMAIDDFDAYLLSLEAYNPYCQKIMANGSIGYICVAFSDISVRAVELQQQCQLLIEREIQSFNFYFQKSILEEFLQESCDNLIGEIEEDDSMSNKRSKQSLLLEQSNEIYRLREEIKSEITNRESLRSSIAQLRITLNKEVENNKILTKKLSKEHDHGMVIHNLEQMVHNHKVTCSNLQTQNKALKQELDIKIMTNSSLKSNNDILKDKFDKEKIANKSLQAENIQLKEELDARIMTNSSLQSNNNKLIEDLNKKKIDNKLLQAENHQLWQELDAGIVTKSSLQSDNDELKEVFKISNKLLQVENEKLKQELEKEQMSNNFVQASSNRIVQEVNDAYKMRVEALKDDGKKFKQEPETTEIVKLPYNLDPVLISTITTKAAEDKQKTINGLTILEKELFVVSQDFSKVEVHDLMSLTFKRRWNLKELISPFEIGSCNRNKCLYIFDHKGDGQLKEILRVDPNGNLIKNWSTGDAWGWGLSVTYDSNVILTVYNKHKLNEYSPDGQLIREINLSSGAGICHPWHAIKLTNGRFIVGLGRYSDDLHRVCLVDGDGKLVKSVHVCGKHGLNRPFYLSVDGDGSVMVADLGNSRVLLFDSDLENGREILSKEKHGLRRPWRILLDEPSGRLFVADDESLLQGILIFDLK